MSDTSDDGEPFRLRDESEASEDERPAKKRRTAQQAPLRAKGLGFVSASSQVEDDDDTDDPDDERPSMGSRINANGFQNAFNIGEYNGGSPERSPSPESGSGLQTPNAGGRGPSAFNSNGKIQKNSFAARMMAKMGHIEGQGLGKSAQGISAPIQAQLLQSRAGLGHGVAPENPKRTKKEKTSQPSVSGASTPKLKAAPKKRYEVTAIESRGLHIPETMKSLIIDATGAETKAISSMSGFSTPTNHVPPVSEAAKASARIKMQLQAYADAWDATQEQETRLAQEDQQLQAAVELHAAEEDTFQSLISQFEKVSADDSGEPRDWEQVIARLQDAQDHFTDYMEDLDLPEIAASCLEAPFRRELAEWDPLLEPSKFISSFQSIGALLELEKANRLRHRKRATYFESLLVTHWFPQIRIALKDWPVYDPDPAVNLIECWRVLIPSWLLYKIIHELVLPKLIEAVRRFPKVAESNATVTSSGNGSTSSKNRKAPELHSWLFDWWALISSDDLVLERFTELKTLVKQKVDSDSWPVWKPLIGSRKSNIAMPKAISTASRSPTSKATVAQDVSFKDIVEEWCSENNLLMRSTGSADSFGRLLYRLQGAEHRSKGILVYLQEDVVFSEDGEPYGLDDNLATKAMAR